MAQLADVRVPPNDEGTRATILRWCKQVGDTVIKDEPLLELETDKVTVEVPAPADGTLVEVLKPIDAEVVPGEVVGRLSLGESEPIHDAALTRTNAALASTAPRVSPAADAAAASVPLSPSVRRLLAEHAIAASDIKGTGRDNRITAQDVIHAATRIPPPRQAGTVRVAHTAMRRRVAEHMTRSLLDLPHVTTLFEADLTRVLAHRACHAADYQSRGARLTLTVYFISACARALREHREINATFHADALELHGDVNIGVGTALGNNGLIVPVIHHAQELSLLGIAQRLGQLVAAARGGTLTPEDVRGGTFTISNHGVGGSLLAAPIVINQTQVAILGVGKVERRVCAVQVDGGEAIGVRSMCFLTLTIDHRALDAFQANAFLSSVVNTLEQWPADES
jgi:2-oxoglutarate dehydrogenase E2 component (dihydrolipoamide succinyltransferase)